MMQNTSSHLFYVVCFVFVPGVSAQSFYLAYTLISPSFTIQLASPNVRICVPVHHHIFSFAFELLSLIVMFRLDRVSNGGVPT